MKATAYPRQILGIKWFDFVKNVDIIAATNLPSLEDAIRCRCNSLFGRVVRLSDRTPAHRALELAAEVRTGSRPNTTWCRTRGRPCQSWIQQIGDGTPYSISAEWSRARDRGDGGSSQRTTAVYALR